MSSKTAQVTQRVCARVGMCMLGTAALMLPPATAAGAEPGFHPMIIRGTSSAAAPDANQLRLAYQVSFENSSLEPSLDKLNAGAMVPGDPLIPGTNPTLSFAPGEAVVSVHRPLDLSPDAFPAESLFATPVSFGPGSVVRLRATYRAPVGPLPGGGAHRTSGGCGGPPGVCAKLHLRNAEPVALTADLAVEPPASSSSMNRVSAFR